MPAYMKEAVGDRNHPMHKDFMDLVMKGCPKCRESLRQKGNFPIGIVYCSNYYYCPREYEFDLETKDWKIGPDGNKGIINERFMNYWATEEGKKEAEARKKRKYS